MSQRTAMISRKVIKRHLPSGMKRQLESLRRTLNGPGIEADVLHPTTFVPDSGATPRITLILPDLAASKAFGGVMTALAFVAELRTHLQASGIEMRLVTEAPVDASDNVLTRFPGLADAELVSLAGQGRKLPMRAREMCVAYNWWISVNLETALHQQAEHFAQAPLPRVHLIQEYEPQFYPFSSAHLLAHWSMGLGDGLWGVFNTRELFDYWQRQGHTAAKTYVLEPRMNPAIRPALDDLSVADKTRTLLVYGRPNIPRNAFFLVHRGLEAWGARYGAKHGDWKIVSAGEDHPDMPLGGGQVLRGLGKLSLDDYGALLRETAIGLSLMVSPHPSYPPLELAHFGARVLTNRYTGKTPEARHENLIAVDGYDAETIASAVEHEIQAFEADPSRGLTAQSHMTDFLEPESFDSAKALAADIVSRLSKSTDDV